jgi:hypothetical protein
MESNLICFNQKMKTYTSDGINSKPLLGPGMSADIGIS